VIKKFSHNFHFWRVSQFLETPQTNFASFRNRSRILFIFAADANSIIEQAQDPPLHINDGMKIN